MPPVQEREIRNRITPAQKLSAELHAFAVHLARIAGACAIIIPLLCLSFLTLDIPVRFFNQIFFFVPGLRPSDWLTVGHLVMSGVPVVSVLVTRTYGGQLASRAVMVSWFIVALLILFELSVLASVIEDGDFPSTRFIIGFVSSAMTGQLLAIAFYDVARGGGAWWRAPFYALMLGYSATALIYFPIVYWISSLPWGGWMVGDLMVRMLIATACLPIYAMLRKSLVPRGGYGGR